MGKGFVLAWQFLTRLPLGLEVEFSPENLQKSLFFYPFIGLLLGALASIPIFFHGVGASIVAFFSLFIMVFVTGGLHLDGLADTCDGFSAGKDRGRTLEIMKDSRLGTFGVLGLLLVLFGKWIFLVGIIENIRNIPPDASADFGRVLPFILILMMAMGHGRLMVLYMMGFGKLAKKDGLGAYLANAHKKKYIVGASAVYLAIGIFMGRYFCMTLLASFVVSCGISHKAYQKINGLTGDIYGATIEIVELFSLMVAWIFGYIWI